MIQLRRWLPILVLLLALAFGSRALQDTPNGRWLPVETRDLIIGIPLEGELKAVESASLTPPPIPRFWNYKVSFIAADGKQVRQGQPVIRFDSTELQQRLMQKMGERDSAEKELEKAVTDLKIQRRDLELQLSEAKADLRKATFEAEVPEDLVAAGELKTALIDQRMAKLRIEHLQRNLDYQDEREKSHLGSLEQRRLRAADEVEKLEEAIASLTVKAPRDGTIILNMDRRRQKVKVGDSVWRARKILEIPDLSTMQIEAEVAEADAGRLTIGQKVTFRLDAHPDREYQGSVQSIRRAVQIKSRSNPQKVVKAIVAVETTDTERMRPGMRLRGTVEIDRLPDAVVVPEEAIFTDSLGTWVLARGTFRSRKVQPELGPRNDRYFQVLSGLEPGEAVFVQSEEVDP